MSLGCLSYNFFSTNKVVLYGFARLWCKWKHKGYFKTVTSPLMSCTSYFNWKYGRYLKDVPLCAWQADRSCRLSKIRVRASSACQTQSGAPSLNGRKYVSRDFSFKQCHWYFKSVWLNWWFCGLSKAHPWFISLFRDQYSCSSCNVWALNIFVWGHFPCLSISDRTRHVNAIFIIDQMVNIKLSWKENAHWHQIPRLLEPLGCWSISV